MSSPKKILILGANGFVGTNLMRKLSGNTIIIKGYSRNQPKSDTSISGIFSEDLINLVLQFQPDFIINLVGSSSVINSISSPLVDFQTNVQNCLQVLETIRVYTPYTHLIYISSAAVYGEPTELPITEEHKISPISPYGSHKTMAEMTITYYSQQYNLSATILRLFSAYGPMLKRQILWDICEKVRLQPNVELFGTGDETRDFIYIDDVIQLIQIIILSNSLEKFQILNVASGKQTKISEVAKLVLENLNSTKSIIFSNSEKPGDPKFWQAEISKIRSLGFSPQYSFEEGVTIYTNWYKDLYGIS